MMTKEIEQEIVDLEIIQGLGSLKFTENSGIDSVSTDSIINSGRLVFREINDDDVVNVSTGLVSTPKWSGGELSDSLTRALQSGLKISEYDEQSINSLNWSYQVQGIDLNFLAEGETISFSYFVEVSDGSGGIATDTLNIEINGTNDSPRISAEAESSQKNIIEEGDSSIEGGINAEDKDNDSITWSVQGSKDGAYGSIEIDELTGDWTYNLENESVQQLSENQLLLERFTLSVNDSAGGVATQAISIQIRGKNDDPEIITGIDSFESIENNGEDSIDKENFATSGTIEFRDIDANNVVNITSKLRKNNRYFGVMVM